MGKPYIEGKTHWPEGVEYNYRGGGHELRLFYRDLTPKEYDAIASVPARFAFAVSGDVIFFFLIIIVAAVIGGSHNNPSW